MTDQKVDLKEKKRNTSTPSLPRGPISPPAVHSSSLKLTYSLSPTACEVRHFVRMYSVGINRKKHARHVQRNSFYVCPDSVGKNCFCPSFFSLFLLPREPRFWNEYFF
ncbi:hypothetical protein AMECASPLE_002264 [Ameca splendens]|uniref:Uncharacterized protein n=1 Tax=Ameca splendens TaxID=208324 RepID=A0ABV0XBC9_9TELE